MLLSMLVFSHLLFWFVYHFQSDPCFKRQFTCFLCQILLVITSLCGNMWAVREWGRRGGRGCMAGVDKKVFLIKSEYTRSKYLFQKYLDSYQISSNFLIHFINKIMYCVNKNMIQNENYQALFLIRKSFIRIKTKTMFLKETNMV